MRAGPRRLPWVIWGLTTDRLGAVGGELQVSSAPGSGTTISGAISLSANARSGAPPRTEG